MDKPAKKITSILGIISILIAVFICICFVIFEAVTIIRNDEDAILVSLFITLVTAPIGIIIGAIAAYTKRAWLGLALNIIFLGIDVLMICYILLKGVTAFR